MKIFVLMKNLESSFTYSSFMSNKQKIMERFYEKQKEMKSYSIEELIKTKIDKSQEIPEEIVV